MHKIVYHYYYLWYKLWRPLKIMDTISREASRSTLSPYLSPKSTCTAIQLPMEPSDATTSCLEELFLQDKILRILNSDHTGLDVTFLYKNENFLSNPSSLSYFDDDVDLKNSSFIRKILSKRNDHENLTVMYGYYPVEQHADAVNLPQKRNVIQKVWDWLRDHCCV